jgi:ribosome biogenesis GTPase A
MWPKIEHESDGLMLAASHAIGENAYVEEEVAEYLAGVLAQRYPGLLERRYGIDPSQHDAVGLIEAIARRRGFLLRGGAADYRKAALALLVDYRTGGLGRISLETPASRIAMLEAAKKAAAPVETPPAGPSLS